MAQNDTITVADFSTYITDRTKDFTGRDWVFAEIGHWLADPEGPSFFIITGEPGVGKSAIAARLTQMRDLGAYHFCIARRAETIDPFLFARSLSQQLCRFDGFAAGILKDSNINLQAVQNIQANYGYAIGNKIETLVVNAPSASLAFTHAVIQPLRALFAGGFDQQVVILVDALDEAVQHKGTDTIVHLLANAGTLPLPVRFVLTSRPEDAVLGHFEQRQIPHLLLDAKQKENLDDIRRYVHGRVVVSEALQGRLAEQDMAAEAFAERVAIASDGNFLYVVWLLSAIAQGTQRFDELEALPHGLDGIYREFLRTRRLGDERQLWRSLYRPLLGVLAAARAPLRSEQLARFTSLKRQEVRDVLGDISQFLDPVGKQTDRYQLYHQSVADFLGDEARAEELWIDLVPIHQTIVTNYRNGARSWEKVDWQKVDEYGLIYLSSHLYMLRGDPTSRSELYQLVCWPLMEAKRAHTGSDRSFVEDVDLAIRTAASEEPPNWLQLVRNCLLYATLTSLAANVPSQMLALLAQAGRVRQAEGYAALLQNPGQRSEAYQQISAALLAKGESEQATVAAQWITVAWRRAVALIPLLDRMDGQTSVSELVTQTLTEVARGGDEPQKSDSLQALAVALARIGDIEQLNRIVTAPFVNELQKSIALQQVIRTLGNVGKLPSLSQLFSWVDALPFYRNKTDVLTTLVRELIRQRDSQATQQAFDQLAVLGLEEHRASIIATLAPYVAAQGNLAELEQLQSLSENIDDVHARLKALSALARASAQMGDKPRVSDFVPQIVALGERAAGDDPPAIASTQSNIAETLAVIGAEHEAKRAIEQALMAAQRTRFAPPFGVTGTELLDLVRLLAQTGAVDSALALSELAPTPADRVYVRCRIAAVLAETSESERARTIAEEAEAFVRDVEDPNTRAVLLGWIASAQLRVGNRERAADLVDVAVTSVQSIEDITTRAHLLGEASTFLVQLDFPDRARDVAARAAAEAEAIEDTAVKLVVLSNLAAASLPIYRQPLWDRTAQLADEIRGQASQISNPDQVVEALARIGLTDHALEIASPIDNAARKRSLLIAIMRGARSQEPEAVREIALRCATAAKAIAAADDRAITLEFVARTLLVAEAYDEALAVAESIEHPDLVPQAFGKFARALAQTEDKQRAEDLALRALQALTPGREEHIQTRVLCDIAFAYAHVGQDRKASDVIAQAEAVATAIGSAGMGNDRVRTQELIRVAETLILIGEPQRAADVAQRAVQMVTLNGRIAYGLSAVVRARALLGDYDGAMELLNTIEEPARPGGFSLSNLVEPLLQIGKFEETLTLAERVGIDGEGGYVLDDVAAALSKTPPDAATIRYANRVLLLATSLNVGWMKARTLGEIASVLASAGEIERPKALSRQALATSKTDKDATFRKELVEKVARVFGRVGDRDGLELALELAATLEGKQDRLSAQIAIAQAFLRIGAAERIIEIASRAIEFIGVEGDKHMYTQARALSTLSQIMADMGEQEHALALAQRAVAAAKAIRYYAGQTAGEADKDGALAATAQVLARSNGVDEALTIAEVIMYKLNQVCVLREAASGIMQAGNRPRARRVAKQANTVALEHKEKLVKAYLLCAAAQTLATIGDTTGARKMLRRVHNMEPLFENMANKALVWSTMGQVFAQIGDERLAVDTVQTAWNAAQHCPQRWDGIWALLAVANAMTLIGMHHEAVNAAEQALRLLEDLAPGSNEGISGNLHLYPITQFNTTWAQIAAGIPWRSDLAVLLAAAQVLIGADHRQQAAAAAERALAAASAIGTDAQRLVALSLVSGALTAVGQQEKALASLFTALELAYKIGRQHVLEVLWFGAATIAAIDQGQTLRTMAAAIVEIIDRWPPEARTLEQATRHDGTWDTVIGVAGRDEFESKRV